MKKAFSKKKNGWYIKQLQARNQYIKFPSLIRLRDILCMEDTLYQQELINDCKTKAEEDFKSRESRLLGLKAERERQRLKFVEEMKVQRLM